MATCSICLEDFTKPKLLPCGHTFCEKCLGDHIKAQTQLNKFNCSMCRSEIQVPEGGASAFPGNFYLESEGRNKKDFCFKHKTKEVQVYCQDCNEPCCAMCVIGDHKNHTVADLEEVENELKHQFLKLKTETEKKIKLLQEHSETLKTNKSQFIESSLKSCCNVDLQLNAIYQECKRKAEAIKDEIMKSCEEGNRTTNTWIKECDEMRSIMEEWRDYSDVGLRHESVIEFVGKTTLKDLQEKTNFDISTILQTPVVRSPYYSLADIGAQSLTPLLGKIPTMDDSTFTVSFDVDQVLSDSFLKSKVNANGMSWRVGVKRSTDVSLPFGIYLWLGDVDDETINKCECNYSWKLLHNACENLSVKRQCSCSFMPGGSGGKSTGIEWQKLVDRESGFLDTNNKFTIQFIVSIISIERC
ncbi:tripartite motif-containing protein 59-like [Patella vulgata]|uniref:tripartite motif-containing protein 59-like n=1 Tax=Patella vulgata TaxID=6465 RepID=UPI00217FCD12|nr:tripartite motif-containing protein 59-like [Patella vulgata]